jgi:hypothetical protein
MLLAWCDSCPETEIDSLLDWQEHWMQVLRAHDRYYLPNPAEEFRRRCTDYGIRRDALLASLRRNLASLNGPDEQTREWARQIAAGLWVSLLREAAIRNPSKEQLTPYPEEWHSWLFLTFSETPFKELAETGKQLHRIPNEYLVQSLWIWRHGAKQWKNLHSYAFCNQEWRVFDRLAEIIPSDDLESLG